MENENIYAPPQSDIQQNEAFKENLTYFHVSIKKLIIMGILTLGFYELIWFYKHWDHIKYKMGKNIKPVWRSIFAIIYSYWLFKKIKEDCEQENINVTWVPIFMFIFYFIFGIVSFLPLPFTVFSFLGLIPLVIVQTSVNQMVEKDENCIMNTQFTKLNFVWIAIGIFLFIGIVLDSLGLLTNY